jgi:hypothetical protein
VEVEGVSPSTNALLYCCIEKHIVSSISKMSVRLIGLPAVIRSQVFETCLSKRCFSISSKASGHENPLVSRYTSCDKLLSPKKGNTE